MKRKTRKKREEAESRLKILKALLLPHGIEIQQFNPIHYRILGETVIDYWPTTGRAWLTGTSDPAVKMTPEEIATTALAKPGIGLLPEGAAEHLLSLN